MLPSPHLRYESICAFYVLGHDSYFGRSSWVLLLMRSFPHDRSYKVEYAQGSAGQAISLYLCALVRLGLL